MITPWVSVKQAGGSSEKGLLLGFSEEDLDWEGSDGVQHYRSDGIGRTVDAMVEKR